MKFRNVLFSMAAATVLLFSVSCGDSSDKEHAHSHDSDSLEGPGTKITKISEIEAIFDLQTMEDHKTMMKLMKLSMSHDPASTHAVLLTLTDEGGHLLKDASVTFRIRAPNGTVTEKNASVMSGEGMVHYAADSAFTESGEYSVTGIVSHPEIKGEGTVVFTLPLP